MSMRVLYLAAALAAPLLVACGGSSSAVSNAALGTSLALGASALERAQGGCYAVCVHGTACNRASGLCEPTGCKGDCAADQVCEVDAFGERCVRFDPGVFDPGLGPAWDPASARDPSRPQPLLLGDDH